MAKLNVSKRTLDIVLPYLLLAAGTIGLIASLALTYDKIQVLTNNGYEPACNINPILSCGSVMKTEQASLLGLPNTIFGIIAFSMLITFGFLLASGAKVAKWIWQAAQAAATLGVLFMHYLFFQGVYRINAICPWCFLVWMITIPVFWYITLYNLRHVYVRLPAAIQSLTPKLQKNHGTILIIWYLTIFAILIQHFWYYWSTLL